MAKLFVTCPKPVIQPFSHPSSPCCIHSNDKWDDLLLVNVWTFCRTQHSPWSKYGNMFSSFTVAMDRVKGVKGKCYLFKMPHINALPFGVFTDEVVQANVSWQFLNRKSMRNCLLGITNNVIWFLSVCWGEIYDFWISEVLPMLVSCQIRHSA